MTRTQRRLIKAAVTGGSLLWMVLAGWLMMIMLPDGVVENHATSSVKDRMSACAGSFSERYQCKERIIVESGQETFYALGGRFLLVILPPIMATVWASAYLRRHPLRRAEGRRAEANDWKARAQMHTETQSPQEAAEALHLAADALPHLSPKGHHLIGDIAPVEDWQARANSALRGRKPRAP